MFKLGMKADTIQFWILVVMALTALTTFSQWADARYFHADAAKDLKWEIHAVYTKVLTAEERAKIELEREQRQDQ